MSTTDAKQPPGRDSRPTAELIALALAQPDSDSDIWWDAVATMHGRGGEEEFRQAASLCASADPQKRELGSDILAQLGWGRPTFVAESVDILLRLINDADEDVKYSAAMSLGHRRDQRAIPALCRLALDADRDYRFATAFALGNMESPEGLAALIALTRDVDTEVRDWATFGLGTQWESDSSLIREALLTRCDDEVADVRGEALVGLARRGDSRAQPLVLRELGGEFHGCWAIDAAALLPHPSFISALLDLRRRWEANDETRFGTQLDEALARCTESSTLENNA